MAKFDCWRRHCVAMTYSSISFMCRWLQQHQHALGPLADRTVQQLGLADHWVLKTPLDTSCIQVVTPLQCSKYVCAPGTVLPKAQTRLLLRCSALRALVKAHCTLLMCCSAFVC